MLTIVAKIFKTLNSETEPFQISLALCFAMIAGLTPLWSLHNFIVLLLVLILRVNLATFILAWLGFSGIAYLLDPVLHAFGLHILTADALKGFWTSLYNSTLWRLSNYNNSLLMGSLITSLGLFVPLFFLSNMIIRKYREHIFAWVMKSRIVQVLKASKFYGIYKSVSDWGGLS
ncbi:MAG: TIGR03546 family protein [Desulfobacterales bacterium]|nr:TIGR03546 family protein [Desulfobacterales bacterium]MDX2512298.1 TIGR03546 family protein [Desulfobacterales bacterium]